MNKACATRIPQSRAARKLAPMRWIKARRAAIVTMAHQQANRNPRMNEILAIDSPVIPAADGPLEIEIKLACTPATLDAAPTPCWAPRASARRIAQPILTPPKARWRAQALRCGCAIAAAPANKRSN
jgi:hypothetical protein